LLKNNKNTQKFQFQSAIRMEFNFIWQSSGYGITLWPVCVSIEMLLVVLITEQKSKQIGQIKKVRGLLTTIEHLWKKLQEFGFSWNLRLIESSFVKFVISTSTNNLKLNRLPNLMVCQPIDDIFYATSVTLS
jgi:hypothetical protein